MTLPFQSESALPQDMRDEIGDAITRAYCEGWSTPTISGGPIEPAVIATMPHHTRKMHAIAQAVCKVVERWTEEAKADA